ncbi:MAG: PLP-dependent aminotransferase family protein [Clostridiales bacterium]|nr:PLP-dependent aminotransferase family protein [Clostridiales bacterium]
MNTITPVLDYDSKKPLYIQLYDYIKTEISSGRLAAGSKLPSLRALAAALKISITTIELAYNQLAVEGYITSKEKSGYYVNANADHSPEFSYVPPVINSIARDPKKSIPYYSDTALFDFVKWKKCLNYVINEYSDLLAFEASPQGEEFLRQEIAHYLYMTRGVICSPEQIIIAAGTQPIINLACSFLSVMNIDGIAYEDPGYLPSVNVFKDRGFKTIPINISESGASLEEISKKSPSVICVSPSIQFPMGTVMPIGKRYALLKYAAATKSIIIEDDYASELRYFGKPVPPLKSLDSTADVLYLGSFSSVLFPSIKISYMVLPAVMMPYSDKVMAHYNQTCSKTEQLALATYMNKGLLHTHVKKLRNLYSQKIKTASEAFSELFGDKVTILSKDSGLNMLIKINSERSYDAAKLSIIAREQGINIVPLQKYQTNKKDEDKSTLIFYYSTIPINQMYPALEKLYQEWKL